MTRIGAPGCDLTDPVCLTRRQRHVSSRQYRLFACACCRRIWPLVGDARSRRAVEVAESFADGVVGRKELRAARAGCPARGTGAGNSAAKAAASAAAASALEAAQYASFHALEAAANAGANGGAEQQAQAGLFHDIVGPAGGRPPIDPSWLHHNGGTVLRLARVIYEEGRFQDLPLLADALLDAGCTSEVILDHCRGHGVHVRGCWLLDALRAGPTSTL